MEKVKIKLQGSEADLICRELQQLVEGMETDNNMEDQIIKAALIEFCFAMKQLHAKCIKRKPYSKQVTASQALIFFSVFYGYENTGPYAIVIFKEVCKQIEEQLFIKGDFILPQKGVYGNG